MHVKQVRDPMGILTSHQDACCQPVDSLLEHGLRQPARPRVGRELPLYPDVVDAPLNDLVRNSER